MKDAKVFLRKEKKKRNNMVVKETKIYQKMKNKCWLSIEEISQNEKKSFITIIGNRFCLENSFSKQSVRIFSYDLARLVD